MIFLFRTLGYNSKSRISYLFFFFLPLVTFFIFHMFLSLVGKFGLHPFCLYKRKHQDLQGEKEITCVQTICYKDLKSLYNSFNQKFQASIATCVWILQVLVQYRCYLQTLSRKQGTGIPQTLQNLCCFIYCLSAFLTMYLCGFFVTNNIVLPEKSVLGKFVNADFLDGIKDHV